MRLGISTGTLRRILGEEASLRAIAAAGFDCVDYSFFYTEKNPEILGEDFRSHAEKTRLLLDDLGLACGQTHAPYEFSFCNDMRESDPRFLEIVRSMESSAILGAPYVVVHTVLSPVYVDMPEYNVRFFRSLEPYCRKYGVRIAIENIFDRSPTGACMGRFCRPEEMKALLDRLNPECFAMCLDTGHATITGVDPSMLLRRIGSDRVRVLHVQDTCLLDDDHMLPLLGDQPWDSFCQAMAETGYQGDFSLEVPGFFARLEPELMDAALNLAHGVGRALIRKTKSFGKQGM